MVTIKLYPFSSGDNSVGISGWECEVILELPSDDLEQEDLGIFKEQIKGLYESWECEGVKDEIDIKCYEVVEADMEMDYLKEQKNTKRKIKALKQGIKENNKQIEELRKLFKLDKESIIKQI